MMQETLGKLSRDNFTFFSQNPLVQGFLSFIDVYKGPHMIYLSKTEYCRFNKSDGKITEKKKYPEGFSVSSQLSGTYLNHKKNLILLIDDKTSGYLIFSPDSDSYQLYKLHEPWFNHYIYKLRTAILHNFNHTLAFLANYKYSGNDVHLNGIITQNIKSKRVKKILEFPSERESINGILLLENNSLFETKLYHIEYLNKNKLISIKYIDCKTKKVLQRRNYKNLELWSSDGLLSSGDSGTPTQDLVVYQDSAMIIFNLPAEMYLVHYKVKSFQPIIIAKKEQISN